MQTPREDHPAPRPGGELAGLFEAHHRGVLATAFRVTGTRQDAEDVLQTVFLRLAQRDRLPRPDGAGGYLHRAAVNASIDLLRTRARAGAIPLDEPGVETPREPSASPERLQRDREFRHHLRRALLELPERNARIFVLRYFEGLANKEIAGLLELSQTTVAVHLHRARGRLRSMLREFVMESTS